MILKCKGIVLALFLPLLLLTSCFGKDKELEAKFVNAAVKAIDNCYHWGGETGDQSDERNAQIMKGINRDCPEADRIAMKAYESYPNNLVLSVNLIKLIDFGYSKAFDKKKNSICDTAIPYFKKKFLESDKIDSLYRYVCPEQAAKLYGK